MLFKEIVDWRTHARTDGRRTTDAGHWRITKAHLSTSCSGELKSWRTTAGHTCLGELKMDWCAANSKRCMKMIITHFRPKMHFEPFSQKVLHTLSLWGALKWSIYENNNEMQLPLFCNECVEAAFRQQLVQHLHHGQRDPVTKHQGIVVWMLWRMAF